ncbi:hypothetical protein LCGC14_0984550 [marine sediment metagenome]|uniref:Uncharacterized protein n=1 Tax=marine sediment metagenome TaxID=412755 RepID=A0A0F9N7M8_9ZZZZ
MSADERRQAMAATLPEGECDCNPCLDSLIAEAAQPDTITTTFILEDVDDTPETVMRHVEAALLNIEGAPWDNVARMRKDQTAEYQTLYPLETVITFGQLAADDSLWVAKIQRAFLRAWDDHHSEGKDWQ